MTAHIAIHAHVRFGSKADIESCVSDVRFTPKSGHQFSNESSTSSVASAIAKSAKAVLSGPLDLPFDATPRGTSTRIRQLMKSGESLIR